MKYNFDEIIDRHGTESVKWDAVSERWGRNDLLPMWVADMDFRTPSFVMNALRKRLEHEVLGYTFACEEWYTSIINWLQSRHGWKVKREELTFMPGIVRGLAFAIQCFTEKGDKVMVMPPVYHPFFLVTEKNKREVVYSPLVLRDGQYYIDFDRFRKDIQGCKILILSNPHNPGGRVWTREELEKLGDICKKHGVIVVSDEIHADFVFDGKHQVFADLKPEYKDFTVICTSPGKTFNIAGLQASNILIPNEALREAFAKQITAAGYSQISAPGIEAVIAAYAQGEEWYQEMKKYVGENITFLHEWMEEYIPQIKVTRTEGTYLVWMDFRGLGIAEENLKDFVENRAGLWLDGGKMFGESGSGFQRINVACPRKTLEKALTQLETAVKNL